MQNFLENAEMLEPNLRLRPRSTREGRRLEGRKSSVRGMGWRWRISVNLGMYFYVRYTLSLLGPRSLCVWGGDVSLSFPLPLIAQ